VKGDEVIWPLSVRIIHWFVALIVLLDAFWLEEGDALHRYAGYAAVILVIIRFVMGKFGQGYVLFSAMPLGFSHTINFLKNHFSGDAHYEGHNPLASVVYIIMWFLIIGLGVTGFLMGLDAFWGDENLETIHNLLSDVLIGLVVIHLLGIAIDAIIYKRKTWMGMIDGKNKQTNN
jgi:cytochrome b